VTQASKLAIPTQVKQASQLAFKKNKRKKTILQKTPKIECLHLLVVQQNTIIQFASWEACITPNQ
jgi:hypothetical protein